jgi:DNA-binding Xre family transcriptional regulator
MNYNKLWKLLIDKQLKKKDLREMAQLSTNVMAKMGKGGDVSTQVLRKISEVLNVKVEDLVDFEN